MFFNNKGRKDMLEMNFLTQESISNNLEERFKKNKYFVISFENQFFFLPFQINFYSFQN